RRRQHTVPSSGIEELDEPCPAAVGVIDGLLIGGGDRRLQFAPNARESLAEIAAQLERGIVMHANLRDEAFVALTELIDQHQDADEIDGREQRQSEKFVSERQFAEHGYPLSNRVMSAGMSTMRATRPSARIVDAEKPRMCR